MLLDFLRRVKMSALVLAILGGLWVLAHWKAQLSEPMPEIFSGRIVPLAEDFWPDVFSATASRSDADEPRLRPIRPS